MTIRKILTEPDPFLRQKSQNVIEVNDEIRSLMDDMVETMYNAPGIGLAAIQIGVPKRVIVIDLSKEGEKKTPLYFVNPEIITRSKNDASYEEGCLSVPNQFAEISRPDTCKLKFLNYDGNEKIIETKGLLATCIQHEMDHLEGILFIDYLSKLKKSLIIKKLSKQKKNLERIVV
jgi:peptide deformylase